MYGSVHVEADGGVVCCAGEEGSAGGSEGESGGGSGEEEEQVEIGTAEDWRSSEWTHAEEEVPLRFSTQSRKDENPVPTSCEDRNSFERAHGDGELKVDKGARSQGV
jgi:hypothetical protein